METNNRIKIFGREVGEGDADMDFRHLTKVLLLLGDTLEVSEGNTSQRQQYQLCFSLFEDEEQD